MAASHPPIEAEHAASEHAASEHAASEHAEAEHAASEHAEAAHAEPAAPIERSIPQTAHDAITLPVAAPSSHVEPAAEVPHAPVVAAPVPAAEDRSGRVKAPTTPPPMDELDTGWDLGDEDPTASPEPVEAAGEHDKSVSTPSSSEMAGDGAVEGDGIDTGWD